ncbi:MAG: NADH-quinone oxidoreductase subunit J [Campylobacterales bacterium]|nr:NADH-quinone oxidoreductase subunit J [Campylobacterales bacterium]
MSESIIFYVLALFLIGGASGMITARRTIFSAASFMLAMIALAGMFALLNQSFLFLAQLLVAVGAIITLSMLVIVSVNISERYIPKEPHLGRDLLLGVVIAAPIVALIITALRTHFAASFAPIPDTFGTLASIGATLFASWVLPFELISLLLLAALIGAVVISRKGERS